MVQQSLNTENSVLSDIKEGMTVYDSANQKLGTVDRLHFGSTSQTEDERGQGAATAIDPGVRDESLLAEVMKTLFPDAGLPAVLGARLIRNGFIRINKGLFTGDLYVLPEQIASVADQTVHLSVTADSLIKD